MTTYTIVGLVGVIFAIAAYLASQLRIIRSDMWLFPAANLACSTMVGVSLIDKWNLPSFILQTTYVIISLYGLARCWHS